MNQTTHQYKNPEWWTDETDSAWDRVKLAIKRDWDQTKHDLGGEQPDTNQNIGNTTRQASGKEAIPPRGEPAYDEQEAAYRFGYGARSEYGAEHSKWDDELESRLREDWEALDTDRDWETDRAAIRYGWDYDDE
ncbi:MAG TPA: hypothetical protein VG347_25325 [Verrucomicrobiae bacterium]|nr:hypothetical protein [Verrucomicrobiae bacterium]